MQLLVPIGGILSGFIGAIDGGVIGHIAGEQMGEISRVLDLCLTQEAKRVDTEGTVFIELPREFSRGHRVSRPNT